MTWNLIPCTSDGKESVCSAGDLGSIARLGRYPGGGNGKPLQFFFFFFLTPVFLPGEFHGQGILAGHRTQDCRSQDTTK